MATNADPLAAPNPPGPEGGAPPAGQRNAYVGPQPFPPDRQLHGRDRELLALTNRLTSERLVLLYSPSGAGKTSLIQAKGGLRERMAGEGFHLLPVVRVGLFADVAAKAGVNRYLLSTLAELAQGGTGPGRPSPEDLAEELRRRGADEQVLAEHLARLTPRADGEDPVQPFLVFDQFEELLTLDPTDEEAKRGFLRPLGAVLRDRDRWALFAMREDYVPSLDPYLPLLPDRLSATFRLDLLGTRAAAAAIREPAREFGVTFEESVVEQIVEQLSLTRVLDPLDRSTRERLGPYVEPVQLQVVCQLLWTQRQLPDRITANDLTASRLAGVEGEDGVTAALQGYYERTVERVARESPDKEPTAVSERAIRNWFEHALISDGDLRLPMLLGEEKKYGLEPGVLVDLANAHLIRCDRRSGGVWYELAHDRLVAPIRKSNRAWRRENLASFQQAAEVWNESGRKADLLVGGEVLAEGERLQGGPAGLWSGTDEEFLNACRAERDRKEAEAAHSRKQARLRWWITCISVGGFILVFGLALWSEMQRRRAQEAKKEADRAREETEKTLAAGLWLPIGRQDVPLNGIEVSALTALGSLPTEQGGARLKFVERALANPANRRRFARRAAAVTQAAVGLNRDLAERVQGIVQSRLAGETAGLDARTTAALAVAELELGDYATATTAASALREGLNKAATAEESSALTVALVEVVKRLPERQKAEVLDEAAKLLLDALDKEENPYSRSLWASALGEVAKGLPEAPMADRLDRAVKLVLDALTKERDPYARSRLAEALGELAKCLAEARRADLLNSVAKLLLDALDKEKDAGARSRLALALEQVAKGLPGARRTDLLDQVAKLVLDALTKEEDSDGRIRLALALEEVAKGLPGARRTDLLDQGAKLVLDALTKEKAPYARSLLASALGEVAKSLPPNKAARLLLDTFDKEEDADSRVLLALALGEVAKALPPDQAAKPFLDALDKAKNAGARFRLASVLADVAKGPPADQAVQLLFDALDKEQDPLPRNRLAEELAKLSTEASVPKGALLLFQALAQHPDLATTLLPALEKVASQLTNDNLQVAVELLKQPLCYGKARQVLLHRVEQLTGQTFSTRWDMVDYLRRHRAGIDLDSPPQRADD
jgi:hypothetical protein